MQFFQPGKLVIRHLEAARRFAIFDVSLYREDEFVLCHRFLLMGFGELASALDLARH